MANALVGALTRGLGTNVRPIDPKRAVHPALAREASSAARSRTTRSSSWAPTRGARSWPSIDGSCTHLAEPRARAPARALEDRAPRARRALPAARDQGRHVPLHAVRRRPGSRPRPRRLQARRARRPRRRQAAALDLVDHLARLRRRVDRRDRRRLVRVRRRIAPSTLTTGARAVKLRSARTAKAASTRRSRTAASSRRSSSSRARLPRRRHAHPRRPQPARPRSLQGRRHRALRDKTRVELTPRRRPARRRTAASRGATRRLGPRRPPRRRRRSPGSSRPGRGLRPPSLELTARVDRRRRSREGPHRASAATPSAETRRCSLHASTASTPPSSSPASASTRSCPDFERRPLSCRRAPVPVAISDACTCGRS